MRILDETKGTGAVTRVLLDASDGEESWGSIGVSENIIEASWEALVDSIEFGMLRGREILIRRPKERVMSDADKVLEVMAEAGELSMRAPSRSVRAWTARVVGQAGGHVDAAEPASARPWTAGR